MLLAGLEEKIISDGSERILEISFSNIELVDFHLNMINSNQEKGLICVEKSIFNTTTILKYNLNSFISLNEYIKSNEVDKIMITDIFKKIGDVIINSSELLLESGNFILDTEHIFIDKSTNNISLINIPLVNKYSNNIEDNFNKMALDLVNSILLDGKIKIGSESFIVRVKDYLKDDTRSINDFIAYVKKESVGVKNSNIRKSPVNQTRTNTPNTQLKSVEKPLVKAPMENREVNKQVKPEIKVSASKEKNIKPINNTAVEENKFIEKLQYKTSRIIITIAIQPIFIGIILLMMMIDGVSIVQIAGGALAMLALDGIIIKNLLDPAKKVKVQVPVKAAADNVKRDKTNKVKKSNIKEKQVKQPVQQIQPVAAVQNIDCDETSMLDEETSFIDDATTVLGTEAYLEVNNGTNNGIEKINGTRYVVGRLSNLKNWITNKGISREHFEIYMENGEYFIKDLGSKNGTHLNDRRLDAQISERLTDGDIIYIPDLTIVFRAE